MEIYVFTVLETGSLEIRVPTSQVLVRSLPGLQIVAFSLCSHGWERPLLFLPVIRPPVLWDKDSTLVTSFNLNHHLKSPVCSIGSWGFSSVHSLSRVQLLPPNEPQHARPPCPSPTPGVYPNSCPLRRWCHPTSSSSAVPFSTCPQSFPASGSFQMSQPFPSGGQNIGVSASTSVLPMKTQDWSPLGWIGWISLQSKGLLESLLQHHSSKASILRHSVFFIVQLSHPYMSTGKTIALTSLD